MNTFPRTVFEDALEEGGVTEYEVRDDYSGRFMYGDQCFGVTVPSFTEAFRMCLSLGMKLRDYVDQDEREFWYEDLVTDLVKAARYDNMGHDVIVYFPGWKFEERADDPK